MSNFQKSVNKEFKSENRRQSNHQEYRKKTNRYDNNKKHFNNASKYDRADNYAPDVYLFGKNAVTEAVLSGANLQKIFLCYGTDTSKILYLARKNKINCVTFDKNKFRELEYKALPPNAKSQGVIALKQIVDTLDLSEYLNEIDISKNPIIAILDGILDPQNLGAISRSAECAGLSAIIVPYKDSAPITPTAVKVSAGALNYISVIQVHNLILTIEKLKDAGFWVVGTDMEAKDNYASNFYSKATAVIIGNEGKGMSASLKQHCDYLVSIPLLGKINSLNASVSAGIMFFEINRQRQQYSAVITKSNKQQID